MHIDFLTIPESPVGIIALMGSFMAALGGFMLLKKRSNGKTGKTDSPKDTGIGLGI